LRDVTDVTLPYGSVKLSNEPFSSASLELKSRKAILVARAVGEVELAAEKLHLVLVEVLADVRACWSWAW
jgi:hypothetical protein